MDVDLLARKKKICIRMRFLKLKYVEEERLYSDVKYERVQKEGSLILMLFVPFCCASETAEMSSQKLGTIKNVCSRQNAPRRTLSPS